MTLSPSLPRFVMMVFCAATLAACSSPDPVPYAGIASSPYLMTNAKDKSGHIPYLYSVPVDWRTYNRVILDPVEIYRGRDQQFDDLSESDKSELAAYMQSRFAIKLGTLFYPAVRPLPNTLRIHLTLTGAAGNTPVLSTLSRFDLAGGLYNGVQAIRGREGMLTGSVIYAVEIYDATSNRLLSAFITKQYPGVYNLGAGMGNLAAAKAGIDKGADALLQELGGRPD